MSNTVRRRTHMVRHLAATTVIVAVATAALAPSRPAHAGGPYRWGSPCFGDEPTNQTALRFALPGWDRAHYGFPYSRVGYPVQPGEVLRIRARGSMKIDSWPWGPSVSPDGDPGTLHPVRPGNVGLPLFGLYGSFTRTGQAFRIGTDSGCVVYRGSEATTLLLRQNDPKTDDNSGTWDIDVKHYKF